MRSFTNAARCVVVLASVGLAAPNPHNSEEHKLIADRGAARVVIPPSVQLPAGVAFVVPDPPKVRAHAWLTLTPGVGSQTGWLTLNWDGPSGQYDFVALYEGPQRPTNTDGYIKAVLACPPEPDPPAMLGSAFQEDRNAEEAAHGRADHPQAA